MEPRRFRTFILGAGFSKLAGLPLASELWTKILAKSDRIYGRDSLLRKDIDRFIEFKFSTQGIRLTPEQVDFEEFLGFLDVEHFLRLDGSDTWSESGNKSQLIVRWLIGQELFQCQQEGRKNRPSSYREFAYQLRGSDYVLTFNYDTVLEDALEEVGRPYRLFPNRLESVGESSSTVDSSRDRDEVVLLKLHGSIDWFDRTSFQRLTDSFERMAKSGMTGSEVYRDYPPRHPIFGRDRVVEALPIVEGPRSPDDPLNMVWRVRNLSQLYSNPAANPLLGASPLLLSPSHQKLLYSSVFKSFWNGLGQSGGMALGLAIIGYSLPPYDSYALQAIYSLADNYANSWYDENFFGWKKLPIRVIDYQPTQSGQEKFRNTYRFLHPERSEIHLSGFNSESIGFLFAETRSGFSPPSTD